MPHLIAFNPLFFFDHNLGLWVSTAIGLLAVFLMPQHFSVNKGLFVCWLSMTVWMTFLTLTADYLPFISRINFIWFACFSPMLLVFIITKSKSMMESLSFYCLPLVLSLLAYFFYNPALSDFNGMYATGSILGGQAAVFASMFFIRLIDRYQTRDLVFFLLFLLLLFATQHRGGMLGLFAVIFLRLIADIRRPFYTLVCFGVLGLTFFVSLPVILDLIFVNGVVSVDAIKTSGRLTIWQTLFDYWPSGFSGFVFGAGGGGARDILIHQLNGFETGLLQPHNEYLRLWFDFGFVGLCLWLLFYYRIFRDHCDFGVLLFVHFLVEALVSNILFWSIFYLTPILFMRRSNV